MVISLNESKDTELKEVVIIGYGSRKKSDNTGSISQLSSTDITKNKVLNATQAIQGKAAGVQVIGTDVPGSSPSLIIRGIGTYGADRTPIYYNKKNTGRPLGNNEGKFEKFRSNYIDERNEPLYPFGFGLSYTTFGYSNLKVSSDKMNFNEKVKVTVEITNTGNYDGKEVVQLYIRDLVGSVTRPLKELKGFQKVVIKKGDKQIVTFEISVEELKFYNSDLDFLAEPGTFQVFVGTDSTTEMKVNFDLIK